PEAIATTEDLLVAAAQLDSSALLSAAAQIASLAPQASAGIRWAQKRERLHPLPRALAAALLHGEAGPPELDVAQLEALAACPFKHFVHYELGLSARQPPVVNQQLTAFHR